jgi:hypothetical protein
MRSSALAPTALAAALLAAPVASTAAAQATEPPAPAGGSRGTVTKVFPVRHVDPRALASVLSAYVGSANPQSELRVVTWTGPSDQLAAVEATVASLDVATPPARNLVLTAWLVDLAGDGGAGTDLPAAVRTAIERLGDARPTHGARLLDRAVLRIRENSHGAEAKGQLSGTAWSAGSYTLRVRHVDIVPAEPAPAVRLDGLALQAEVVAAGVPGPGDAHPATSGSLATDVDLPLGATVAVGATSLTSSGHGLMLVLRAAPAD